ncbi:hypothetical protein GGR53DRAFT_468642 [Hypoxylon sp. FL1150]|nr:hypothetical protein GGR53DRAFT_468642 [Hypoxylon sp. FL1150]
MQFSPWASPLPPRPMQLKSTSSASSALSWEIYGSGCTVTVYENANCQGALTPAQTNPNKCYDSPVQIKSVSATC